MIKLTDDLYMTADDSCYIVGKLKLKNVKGRDVETIEKPSYYSTADKAVRGAIQRILRSRVKEGRITTLSGFIKEYEKANNDLADIVSKLE